MNKKSLLEIAAGILFVLAMTLLALLTERCGDDGAIVSVGHMLVAGCDARR